MCHRVPIKVKRKPITILSEAGHQKYGNWMVFNRPEGDPPKYKIKKGQRILWCPWCGEWAAFKRRHDEQDVWQCTGYCGWANTKEFHVNRVNKLWWENVPLKAIKKIARIKPRP